MGKQILIFWLNILKPHTTILKKIIALLWRTHIYHSEATSSLNFSILMTLKSPPLVYFPESISLHHLNWTVMPKIRVNRWLSWTAFVVLSLYISLSSFPDLFLKKTGLQSSLASASIKTQHSLGSPPGKTCFLKIHWFNKLNKLK